MRVTRMVLARSSEEPCAGGACYVAEMTDILETERLILRRPTLDEVDQLHEAVNDPVIPDMIDGFSYPLSREETAAWISEMGSEEEERNAFHRCMYLKETGELAGWAALIHVDRVHNNAELIYLVATKHRCKGYASEAASGLVDWGFQNLELERIYGMCPTENDASARVLENAGMRREGTFKHERSRNGEYRDLHHYAVVKSEWEEARQGKRLLHLETERLIIRELRKQDAADLVEAFNHPDISEFTPNFPCPYTIRDAKDLIRKSINLWRGRKAFYCAVVLKETGRVIGEVHLSWIYWPDKYAECGFAIGRSYWGQGFATEAVAELLRHAFTDLGMRRIMGITAAANVPSRRVMEKLGMQLECVAREEWGLKGEYPDFAHYVILRSEWERNSDLSGATP